MARANTQPISGTAPQSLGTNVTAFLEGQTLTLVIDLSRPGTPSASGKTMTVATTHGRKRLPWLDDARDAVAVVGLTVSNR